MQDLFTQLMQNPKAEEEKNVISEKKNNKAYEKDLQAIREELIRIHGDSIKNIISERNAKEKLKGFITSLVNEKFPEYRENKDVERIYQDIFGFSFINDYIADPDFEEMNGNAWNDIEILTSYGYKKLDTSFNSPEHAKNIIKKMMAIGNAILNEADPTLDSFIGTGLRLTASIYPVIDEDVGVTFSLRKLAGKEISVRDLVEKYDSYSYEEIDFVETCLKHGVSVLFGGATSSGKTSDMQTIVKRVTADGKLRAFCIEENTRELDFIHKNRDGKILSRVIHTKTVESKNADKLKVDSDLLVKTSLRYHPDIIIPAEMRGGEALSAVESALTGHTIVSSAHIQSVTKAYERLLMLCQKANQSISEDMLMSIIVEAIPIVVFKKYFKEDRSRRCLKIFEATGYNKDKKKIEGQILYKFVRKEIDEDGKVLGDHAKINPPSFKLCQKFYENGCPLEEVNQFNPSFSVSLTDDYVEDFIDITTKEKDR